MAWIVDNLPWVYDRVIAYIHVYAMKPSHEKQMNFSIVMNVNTAVKECSP